MSHRHELLALGAALVVAASAGCVPPAVQCPSCEPAASASPAERPTPPPALPSTYRVPPPDVVAIVDASPPPAFRFSPDKRRMVLATYPSLPGIEVLSQPRLRLAGVRIHPDRTARERTRFYDSLSIMRLEGATAPLEIAAPDGARLGFPSWSPSGEHVAFTVTRDDGVSLWVADTHTGKARRLFEGDVNATLTRGFSWLPDARSLLVRVVVKSRGAPPATPRVPTGPRIQETTGRQAKNRTYQDLLQSTHDDALFAYYATSQLARVTLAGNVAPVGKPGIFVSASASPDGAWLLTRRIERPFSRVVKYTSFACKVEVERFDGTAKRTLAEHGAAEEIPIEGVREGLRHEHWVPTEPATIAYAEALDGGDPERKVPHRDQVSLWRAPFIASSVPVTKVEHRYRHIDWLETPGDYFVTEYDRDRRWTKTTLRALGKSDVSVVDDRSVSDRYGDPGDPLYKRLPNGHWVVQVLGAGASREVLLRGAGATPSGDRPFLDRVKLRGGQKTRLFHAPKTGAYARVAGLLNGDPGRLIVRREDPRTQPNYFLRSADGSERQITRFAHPHPQLSAIDKKLVRYERADGVPLWSELFLPVDHVAGQKHPLVVWAYPRSYKDKATAGQTRVTPSRFTRLAGASSLMFLTQGYAVALVAMPIVGDPRTMNDTFVEQITMDAEAALTALADAGGVDTARVGVMGHSYGAFMVANLLAHTDLFRAGIARSGAYNRTLTPFGFQRERRTLWEAKEVYAKVSPLLSADQINEPLLMTHGEIDQNSGTFPLQSERLFHAMSGLGGTARLVVLPNESHGYRSRESVLHVLAESFAWFDRHVKPDPNPSPTGAR